MSLKDVLDILARLNTKGGALTVTQIAQVTEIANVVLGEIGNNDPDTARDRFNFFLALISFAIK